MCPRGGARSAADHGGDAGDQRLFRLLRADPVDVGIDAAGGDYLTFGGNNLRRRANGDSDVRLDIGITRFADCDNTPLFDTNVGFDDPQ